MYSSLGIPVVFQDLFLVAGITCRKSVFGEPRDKEQMITWSSSQLLQASWLLAHQKCVILYNFLVGGMRTTMDSGFL